MTTDHAMIVIGVSVIGGILLGRAFTWARQTFGRCRRCRAKSYICACLGGPK
jgi:hypothetical protein